VDIVARAREAKLRVDVANKLIYVHMRDCYIVNENGLDGGRVADKAWPVELPSDFESTEKLRATDMTWYELGEFRGRWDDDRNRARAELAARKSQAHQTRAPDYVSNHEKNLHSKIRMLDGMIAGIDAEFHMRPALALGCMCFVLVGCPVGIWLSKSDYLSAFITCFLPIIVLYYPLMLSGINLAKTRQLPAAAIWAANGLMLVIAFALFRRLARN
jgi:lipopolysaccharide export system permease protein